MFAGVVRVALSVCNLAVALSTLLAFESWQQPDQPAATLSPAPPAPSAPRNGAPLGGPIMYFVASQAQADQLQTLFASNAAAAPQVPYKVLVVTTDAAALKLRQSIDSRNVQRAATGRPAVTIIDLRALTPEPPELMPVPGTNPIAAGSW